MNLLPVFGLSCLLVAPFCSLVRGAAEPPPAPTDKERSLFDGQTLAGWEGSAKLWRVQDGCLTGGSLTETVTHNDFLASTRDFTNFIIRFQIKLTGREGFINSGFQIRSQRVPNNSEMAGYQCDYGEPNWYGAIYDESRRNTVLAPSDMTALRPVLRLNDWNDYVIRADGLRITTWINGVLGTDFTEPDPAIPDWGKFGIQVHAGGKALAQVRQVFIQELPPTPPGKIFRGAPAPRQGAKAEAVSPAEELARFTVAPGFTVELVASEDIAAGIGKFVAVDWDQHGNLWTMTALEYPVDANENPAVAQELYASRAKDKVLVFDRDPRSPTGYARQPRVFADGLAIPLGILPYKNGVYVQHGTEIVYWSDTDGDGKADKREVILSGFGVQDSHLFPHQFTRAPGGWIWFAQGAFNYGKVKTSRGREVQFDQTRMARFRYDGAEFDITSQGPCNIWGLFMTEEGETWIQEANDFGYPAMPFHEYANYPGCSQAQWKSYAPEFPGTAPHFEMGGTGLSGLAISDATTWPEAYADVIYIANPITRKIQAIKARREGPRFALTKLPDFIQSSDEMFRPVALRLGPDGCLYFVDWYNKIISHNEVPRNHPERDKTHGRIWRVKHQKVYEIPDFTKLSGDELIAKLGGENTTQSHLAWQAIGDRQMKELAPRLARLVADRSQIAAVRIAALWALDSLGSVKVDLLKPLWREANRNVRREAVRIFGAALARGSSGSEGQIAALRPLIKDPDPDVRAEVARTLGREIARESQNPDRARAAVEGLAQLAQAPIAEPTMKSTQSGRPIKIREAYDREFERYLVRLFLEPYPQLTASFLQSETEKSLPVENRLVAALSLEPKASASQVAELLPALARPPGQEEMLRLAQFPGEPGVGDALKKVMQQPAISAAAMEALLKVRTRLDAEKITPLLTDAAGQLLASADSSKIDLGIKLASAFQLAAAEPQLVEILDKNMGPADAAQPQRKVALSPASFAALKALRDLRSDRIDLFARLVSQGEPRVQEAAVSALAASRDPRGPQRLASLYPNLPAMSRRTALRELAGTKAGAGATVHAVRSGTIGKDELEGVLFDKLHAVLGADPDLAALMQEMADFFRPALRLDGTGNAWVDSDITLKGAFTVETWVRLDPGIDNNDGILGAPGVIDMNFYGGQFRIWIGGMHDAIVAKKKTTPDVWTHLAITRDDAGNFRIYQNGELDTEQGMPVKNKFAHLRIGWTTPAQGTAGWLNEFRVWDRQRTPEEIRANFDRSFEGEARPAELTRYFPGGGPWGTLQGGATVQKTSDFPPLLNPAEAHALAEKFSKFRALAGQTGDRNRGQTTFKSICMACHSVGGQGGQVGPVLNGAGANGVEALLRNILTPNAAMEAGYRAFRVELRDGEVLDGIRVSEDSDAIVLRRPNVEDLRIAQSNVRRASFTRTSMMPEGLLEALPSQDVADLFAYLQTLK